MGMTIDEAIETLLDTRSYGTADIAKSVAIETMQKYQKITEIVKLWNDMNSFDSMLQIREVLEDGKID